MFRIALVVIGLTLTQVSSWPREVDQPAAAKPAPALAALLNDVGEYGPETEPVYIIEGHGQLRAIVGRGVAMSVRVDAFTRDRAGRATAVFLCATTNNFLGSVFYAEPRAFMQRPAAEAVARAASALRPMGYGLMIHDGYRPWYVTKTFWDATPRHATPQDKKWLVADPSKGSKHNRGCAVDLTLYDLKTGRVVEMPSTYDESTQYKDWQRCAIGNVAFGQIRRVTIGEVRR